MPQSQSADRVVPSFGYAYPVGDLPRSLPQWFDAHRVCGYNSPAVAPADPRWGMHGRDGRGPGASGDAYYRTGALYAALGATSYVRHVKLRDEDPWWPSAAPRDPSTGRRLFDGDRDNVVCDGMDVPARAVPLAAGANLVVDWVEEAAAVNVHVIGFYRCYVDKRIADQHRRAAGDPDNWVFTHSPSYLARHQDRYDTHGDQRWQWVPLLPHIYAGKSALPGPGYVVDDAHPDPRLSGLGFWLDITHPGYAEHMETRLGELAEAGLGGVFFDYLHLPDAEGGRGTQLGAGFLAESGLAEVPDTASFGDDNFYRWIRYCGDAIAATFDGWRSAVAGGHPDFLVLASAVYVPGLTMPYHNTKLLHRIHSAKTDWTSAQDRNRTSGLFGTTEQGGDEAALWRQAGEPKGPHPDWSRAFGWTLLRDAANGRPFFLWLSGMNSDDQVRAACGAGLAYGGVVAPAARPAVLQAGPSDAVVDRLGAIQWNAIRAAVSDGDIVGAQLAGAVPLRFAAIHYSEEARDAVALALDGGCTQGDRLRAAWNDVQWPAVHAFETLSTRGVPVGIVDDTQLRAGCVDDYRLVYVSAELPRDLRTCVDALGATAITGPRGLDWWTVSRPAPTPNGPKLAAMTAVESQIDAFLAAHAADVPVRVNHLSATVDGQDLQCRAITYVRPMPGSAPGLVIAITADFEFCQVVRPDDHLATVPPVRRRPPDFSGVTVDLARSITFGATTLHSPVSAVEAMTGTTLAVTPTSRGYTIAVPPIRNLALVVVRY